MRGTRTSALDNTTSSAVCGLGRSRKDRGSCFAPSLSTAVGGGASLTDAVSSLLFPHLLLCPSLLVPNGFTAVTEPLFLMQRQWVCVVFWLTVSNYWPLYVDSLGV